jgi:MOSC domain-containing protein YiiM
MEIHYRFTGRTQAVLLGMTPGNLVTTRQAEVKVTFAGFEGDQHAGLTRQADGRTPYYPRGTEIRNDRQVSIVSIEELEQIAATLDLSELRPEWLGANLLLSGIPRLTRLPPNTRLVFEEGAVLIVQAENLPCVGPGKVLAAVFNRPELEFRFPRAAIGLRGLVACVEKPGTISVGEFVTAEVPEQILYQPES